MRMAGSFLVIAPQTLILRRLEDGIGFTCCTRTRSPCLLPGSPCFVGRPRARQTFKVFFSFWRARYQALRALSSWRKPIASAISLWERPQNWRRMITSRWC